MRPDEWKARWEHGEGGTARFVTFPADSLVGSSLTHEDELLLIEYGLPADAAPFLSFGSRPGLLGMLRSVNDAPPGTDRLVEIGANGSADPICLELDTGSICYLNHDSHFTAVKMNTSVSALVQFLELFRELVDQTIAENGSDAYLDGGFSPDAVRRTVAEMHSIDPSALAVGTMWHSELGLG